MVTSIKRKILKSCTQFKKYDPKIIYHIHMEYVITFLILS